MDKRDAKLLLENLIDRIEINTDTGQYSLPGIITPKEFEALHLALGRRVDQKKKAPVQEKVQAVVTKQADREEGTPAQTDIEKEQVVHKKGAETAVSTADGTSEASGQSKAPSEIEEKTPQVPAPEKKRPPVRLNLQSLKHKNAPDTKVKLCLDFGTAMSKAFASEIEDDELAGTLLLRLGHRASNGKSKDIYPVPSSLWISDAGKVFVGEKAVALSMQSEAVKGRERLDSLKKELILGMKESSPFEQPMSPALNPTDTELSMGDAITLYLGFLTDLATTEMKERYGYSRYVQRNFGLPSWTPERRVWGEGLLKKMLVRAQIVADTFHGKWEDGIDIRDIRNALDSIEKLEKLPEYLVDQGITEPLAVASSVMQEEEPFRGLGIVVDVGAGTTDLALFVIAKNPMRGIFNGFPVAGCNQSLHMAGDTLDNALMQFIMEKAGISTHDPDYTYISRHLRMQIRTYKEDLFANGDCSVNLISGDRVLIALDEFLKIDSVERFSSKLKEKFSEVVGCMEKGLASQLGDNGITIVLTGGGATLPMVQELAEGGVAVHSHSLRKRKMDLVPEEFEGNAELASVYPQMAVAIGGTMPHIIDEKKPVKSLNIPKGRFVLNKAPVTGNNPPN